jgi:hypothetical protein
MNKSVVLYRRSTRRLDQRALNAVTKRLQLNVKLQHSDDGAAGHDGTRALAYGQPCSRLAGVLFYVDQRVAWAEPVKRAQTPARVRRWAETFLQDSKLMPGKAEEAELAFALDTRENEAVIFDGKERNRERVSTDIRSRIELNGIEVVGPRGKVRMVFKTDPVPVFIHIGLWDELSVFEEREVASTIRDRLADRAEGCARTAKLVDLRVVYWAGEFQGGPDLLTPWYFAEMELIDEHAREGAQGPRQVLRVPAFR